MLLDLELCGLVKKYTPFNLKKNSLLARYCISDSYLQFYFKFIKPLELMIEDGVYNNNPTQALKTDSHYKWAGYAYERMVRKNHKLFAGILGFESVNYRYGAYFSRATNSKEPGYQLDLIYDRDDKVYTICEVKYLQSKVSTKVIDELETKLNFFPNKQKKTIHKVLITANGADETLMNIGYFDKIISLKDIFKYDKI